MLKCPSAVHDPAVALRAEQLYRAEMAVLHRNTDRLFAILLVLQWAAAIVVTLYLSPRIWSGTTSGIHPHVWAAVVLGGALTIFPLCFVAFRPGTVSDAATSLPLPRCFGRAC